MRNAGLIAPVIGGTAAAIVAVGLLLPTEGRTPKGSHALAAATPLNEARKGATGDLIACGGGQTLLSSYSQEGDDFVMVGTFVDVSAEGIVVEGPGGETDVSLTKSPSVEGRYYGGEAVSITGAVNTEGTLEATEIAPACQQALVREIETEPAPTEAAQPAESNWHLVDPAAHNDADEKPAHAVTLSADNDDDDDDDGDKKPKNRGEGRGKAKDDDDDD